MKVNITARNTGIKDSFRARAEKKLAKFDKFFGGNAQAQVTVIHSGDHETVEVTIKSEGLFFRAERTADEREDALEAVIDSLFRQIVKNKSKLEKRMKSASFTPEFVEEMDEPEEYRVVKTKRFPVKPMEVDEAILQMNMLDHTFFVFRSAESRQMGTHQSCKIQNNTSHRKSERHPSVPGNTLGPGPFRRHSDQIPGCQPNADIGRHTQQHRYCR